MRKIMDFIREAKAELIKVTWPTRKQVIDSTVIVVAATFAMAVFLGSLDYAFSYLLKTFLIK